MNRSKRREFCRRTAALAVAVVLATGCGDDGTGSEGDRTGATLLGNLIQFGGAADLEMPTPALASEDGLDVFLEPISDVKVQVGNKSTRTGGNGSFTLNDIPVGDQVVTFSGSGIAADYSLNGIEEGSTFLLDEIQVNGSQVQTKHTGTWVGTGGSSASSDPGTQGQIAFTLIIDQNGNKLSGTGTLGPPDNSVWTMDGTENGMTVVGTMELVSSESPCATGGSFTGTFQADTLSADFVEIHPAGGLPGICGTEVHSGTFRVVKQ
jgi:hypothetical protein